MEAASCPQFPADKHLTFQHLHFCQYSYSNSSSCDSSGGLANVCTHASKQASQTVTFCRTPSLPEKYPQLFSITTQSSSAICVFSFILICFPQQLQYTSFIFYLPDACSIFVPCVQFSVYSINERKERI